VCSAEQWTLSRCRSGRSRPVPCSIRLSGVTESFIMRMIIILPGLDGGTSCC
jgi:hypothetical protein